ncbi:metallo-beta-lactamase domain-containing protein 1 isoform X2 [Osmia bicornis bicornis]|uniref:metallo-beta-lactamase domain-containing protein 1 isoform X2 n=1 Tax=Osmia bicornis bicornis TaxID=1437191 RepID=UPI0010F8C701|nr:metallo-beta-lactamase domain-containing protein 1 isoform X2 [Osmia bicornis bicornis]
MCEVIVLFNGYSEKLENNIMKANCSCTLIKASKNIIVDTMTAWDRDKILQEHIIGTCVHSGEIFLDKNLQNEEYKICPEVKVVTTPGHTSDDVTVLVETKKHAKPICFAITGDLFEKEEDISDPSIWKELGTVELQKTQSLMRSYIINIADFIVPGHGPMFCVTDDMRKIIKDQIIT